MEREGERKRVCLYFPALACFDAGAPPTLSGDGRLGCAGDAPALAKGVAVLHQEPAQHRGQAREAQERPRLAQGGPGGRLLLSARRLVLPTVRPVNAETRTIRAVPGESDHLVVSLHAERTSESRR